MRRRWIVGVPALLVAAVAAGVTASGTSTSPVLRTITMEQNPSAVVVDASTKRVFVASNDGNTVAMLDASTGALLRTVQVGPAPGPLAIDEQRAHIFVSNQGDDTLSVLDARTGRVLRTIGPQFNPWEPGSMVVPGDVLAVDDRAGRVYVADVTDDGISVLDAGTGTRMYTLTRTHMGIPTPSQSTSDPQPYQVEVDGRAGRVFVRSVNTMSVLDARSGRVIRTYSGAANTGLVALDARLERAFVIGSRLSELDVHSGRLLRARTFGDFPNDAVVDDQVHRLFICAGNGLMMLDIRSYTLQPMMTAGCGSGMAIDERTRHLFVVPFAPFDNSGINTGPSSVRVLDTRSGALLSTIRVGWYTGPIAVDERSGRVFVINSGGPVLVPDAWDWLPAGLRDWLPFLPRRAVQTRTIPGSVSVLNAAQ